MANRITTASIKRALESRNVQPVQVQQAATQPALDASALISARILHRVHEGADVCAAFDEVCGDGAFAKLAGDLYDRLNART